MKKSAYLVNVKGDPSFRSDRCHRRSPYGWCRRLISRSQRNKGAVRFYAIR